MALLSVLQVQNIYKLKDKYKYGYKYGQESKYKYNLNEGGVLRGDVVRPLLLFVVVLRRGGVVL